MILCRDSIVLKTSSEIIDNVYLNMKSKHRKSKNQRSAKTKSKNNTPVSSLYVKFDVSKTNISCFMNPNRLLKSKSRSKSRSIIKRKRTTIRIQKSIQSEQKHDKVSDSSRKKQVSPDLLHQSSKQIISYIEQQGTSYCWQEICDSPYEKQQEQDVLSQFSIWGDFPEYNHSLDKSFASTNDNYKYQTNYQWKNFEGYFNKISLQSQKNYNIVNNFTIEPQNLQKDWRTTIMIRNIPNKYSINELAQEIDQEHPGIYDFLYLPCDIRNQCNVGYGFINFVNTCYMNSFYEKFHNYIWKKYRSEKICILAYARLQGLNQLIQHFQNSKVFNQKDKKYRPIIKYQQIHNIVRKQQGR